MDLPLDHHRVDRVPDIIISRQCIEIDLSCFRIDFHFCDLAPVWPAWTSCTGTAGEGGFGIDGNFLLRLILGDFSQADANLGSADGKCSCLVNQVFLGGLQCFRGQFPVFLEKLLGAFPDGGSADVKGTGSDTAFAFDQVRVSLNDLDFPDRKFELLGKQLGKRGF